MIRILSASFFSKETRADLLFFFFLVFAGNYNPSPAREKFFSPAFPARCWWQATLVFFASNAPMADSSFLGLRSSLFLFSFATNIMVFSIFCAALYSSTPFFSGAPPIPLASAFGTILTTARSFFFPKSSSLRFPVEQELPLR